MNFAVARRRRLAVGAPCRRRCAVALVYTWHGWADAVPPNAGSSSLPPLPGATGSYRQQLWHAQQRVGAVVIGLEITQTLLKLEVAELLRPQAL